MQITIITPAFNSENTIEKTILSVIRQKSYILQYIIIDGGSTDKTLEIISKYRAHINCLVSEKDKGIADAYNKGIKLAQGDLIGIIAADDQLIINAIEAIHQTYDGNSDIVCGNIIDFNGTRYRRRKPNVNLELLLRGTSIPHPAAFIRKDSYSKYGDYSLSYRCAIDRELFLRFYKSGAKFQIMDVDVSLFASGAGISTANPCKVAYPEDCRISSDYGVPVWKSKLFLWYSVGRYYAQRTIKRVLIFLSLETYFYEKMSSKINTISEDEIRNLKTF